MALVGQRFLLTIGGNDGRKSLVSTRARLLLYCAVLTDVDSKRTLIFQESTPWRMCGPLIPQLSHMNGENLSRKVKAHHHACKYEKKQQQSNYLLD
jgi:hypothetical protein